MNEIKKKNQYLHLLYLKYDWFSMRIIGKYQYDTNTFIKYFNIIVYYFGKYIIKWPWTTV